MAASPGRWLQPAPSSITEGAAQLLQLLQLNQLSLLNQLLQLNQLTKRTP
ncbi:MAG: hypothetical protein ACRDX8_11000 [Acidimicrobiales bacterium]